MSTKYGGKAVMGSPDKIMSQKKNGTTEAPPMKNLRWNCDFDTANRISCYNRHEAEGSGYFISNTTFLKEANGKTEFYDSITGKRLFRVPVGRTWEEFVAESSKHGWPSFRDEEVDWEHVRVLPDGETVSEGGTHLGHNLPDSKGNRYCINLVSVAGQPKSK